MLQQTLQMIYNQHDIECNQKYNKTLPYSFHLKAVVSQCCKYITLVPEETRPFVKVAGGGHDLIEDARMTFNDVIDMLLSCGYSHDNARFIAKIIFACTELRGMDRPERHGPEFFKTLKENRLGVFVKLCDIMANVLFSILTNSSMFAKYKAEFPHLKKELYQVGEYEMLWYDLERTLGF